MWLELCEVDLLTLSGDREQVVFETELRVLRKPLRVRIDGLQEVLDFLFGFVSQLHFS